MDPVKEVVNNLRVECHEDYVGLWTVPWHFQNVYNIADEPLRREQSFKVIECLLALPDIGVGQFRPNEEVFEFWDIPTSDALKRISDEWDALGHEPNLGDIAWFTSTP
jgi:hypothetical protein